MLAVQNARVKAMQIASSLNQTLGEARHICEISTEEFTGQDIIGRNERKIKSFQELVNSATVTVATKVFVAFELNAQKNKRKK